MAGMIPELFQEDAEQPDWMRDVILIDMGIDTGEGEIEEGYEERTNKRGHKYAWDTDLKKRVPLKGKEEKSQQKKGKSEQVTPDRVKAQIHDFLKAGKVSPEDVSNLADTLASLKVKDRDALKKELGLKASGDKKKQALTLAQRALSSPTRQDEPGSKNEPEKVSTEKEPVRAEKARERKPGKKPEKAETVTTVSNEKVEPFGKTIPDYREAISWGKQNYGKWQESLSPDELGSLKAWKSEEDNYVPINAALRDPDGKGKDVAKGKQLLAKYGKGLDSSLAKGSLPEDTTLWRGFDPSKMGLTIPKPGDSFADPGYVSTSVVRDAAESQHGSGWTMEVHAPKGSSGAYVEGIESTGQAEFLLPRDSRFVVKGVRQDGDRKVLVVSVETPKGK